MAKFSLIVPNKKLTPLADADKTSNRQQLQTITASNVSSLKNNYGSVLKEVAQNSNVPAELLGSMMIVL